MAGGERRQGGGGVLHRRRRDVAVFAGGLPFRTAAAEMWLYSLADYHIMSARGGFGRIGSYISGRWHQLYAVGYHKKSGLREQLPQNRSCSATDFEVGHTFAENM